MHLVREEEMRSQGYTWNECTKLKAHNAKQRGEKPSRPHKRLRLKTPRSMRRPLWWPPQLPNTNPPARSSISEHPLTQHLIKTCSSHSSRALPQPNSPMAVAEELEETYSPTRLSWGKGISCRERRRMFGWWIRRTRRSYEQNWKEGKLLFKE